MEKKVAYYVSKCLVCQQVKALRQKPAGLLQPLSVPEWKWENGRFTKDDVRPYSDLGHS